MFANDTNLFCSDKNVKTLFQKVNAELNSMFPNGLKPTNLR